MVPVPKLKKLISGTGTEVSNIIKAFTLDAQDGRWEGGINGCGIMLDNLTKSNNNVSIGNIEVEHFGLMCTDDNKTGAWSNHGDDSVYFGFLPIAANPSGNNTYHHSGIGKWSNDGGNDVYEGENTEFSSDSGIAIFIK